MTDDAPRLPTSGTDAAGADAHAAVLTAPNWACSHLQATVTANGAIISLDGGTTDHLALEADTTLVVNDLYIPAGASIMAKNITAGSAYATLFVSIW